MPVEHPSRYGWLTTVLLAICLFGLNFYVCREPFHIEYLRDPAVSGPCEIRMTYDGDAEMAAARVISPLTAFLLALACVPAVLKSSGPASASLREWEYDLQRSLGASGRETPRRV